MRAAALDLAVLALVAACSMIPPISGRRIDAVVSNTSGAPLELSVRRGAGQEIPNAVQPAALPVGARNVPVTFIVPDGDDWWISANDVEQFYASDTTDGGRTECRLMMEIGVNGSGSIGCTR